MALTRARYLFVAKMDVDADREALFNEIYDDEHIPDLRQVPGVGAVARFERQPLTLFVGGERRTIAAEHEPKYAALYEIESPEVLASEAWARAVDRGRWVSEVRPHTRNRQHVLYKLIHL